MSAKHPKSASSVSASGTPGVIARPNHPFPLKRIIAALLLVASAFAAAAVLLPKTAEAKDTVGLDAAAAKQVRKIEDYLNAISTLSSRFMQVTDQGHFAQGRFYMARPGRMRIDYDPPNPVLIVSDGTWVMYKDEELDQLSHIPFSQVPAAMFIGDNVDFFGPDLSITGFESAAGAVRITLERSADPMEGSLTLVFEAKPLQLKKWSVIDAQGMVTTVSLLGPEFGPKLKDDLFKVEHRTLNQRDN